MALLVISLLLLSTAFLSEAIDSVGTVPDLKLGSQKRKLKIPGVSPNCGFGTSCGVEGFYNETEEQALMSVRGSTGTSYLRAVVFGKYEGGLWTPHESVKEPYKGETMPPRVRSYSDRIEKDIGIRPLVEMRGYVPAVLNLRRIDSETPLEYDGDLRIFFSGAPFMTDYSLDYDVYTYGEDMLESARNVDDPSNLEIPEGYAGWLRDIADEAAGDATPPYGKIKNVISYLKENYSYNLEYPPAPAGVDPVEWFLTGSREGVCTHFNSALVLLARSLGIPARLAGGYLIQPEAEAQLVYTGQRHAFSEIPFEELGWIIFDATPAAGCSECEGVEGDGEEPAEEERADTCSPTDSVYNQSSCVDCVNNCTRLSPEGGAGPEVDLFEISGVTGSDYLRTMVGERYDGLWNLVRPDPQPYGGGPISYPVSGYADDPTYAFTISPLKEMGGFIPTALYTNELWLDAEVERYQDQLIFFSTEVFREPYSLSITSFEFDYGIIDGAVTVSDPRYLNVPEDLLDGFRSIALDATSGTGTPYEKLKALEAFLRSNYEYDVNYTRAPEGVDPVGWFLFHEGRGVCTNFNSAFVLLARSLGLPARLVVGYAIDPSAEWQVVNAVQAHSYSEVPFEGIGWITFDATASGGESEAAGEGDGEGLEPVDEVFNQTECEDCVCNCTKMDPEGGVPPEVDLFQIYGVAGTAYLRTMVGEAYDGTWGMIDPSPETHENEVIRHQVSGYASAQTRRFMVAPVVDMGGFIPSTLYVNELDLGWPLQRYPEHQIFFSNRRFNTSYIVSYTQYDYDPETLKGA
ncbi:MAG: transglutaminase-like domain-containing protein, partial [Candidatus Bathyarchaeota archaeon]|nr:transglutaminase-like domain-containing protein [Candidatus Bathyarchaeota archaeon]